MILEEYYRKTPSSGASSWNSYSDFSGVMQQLVVNSSTTTTTFDFTMTDNLGNIVYTKKGQRGIWIDDSKIALKGIYTMAIANASTDSNTFTTRIIWREDE